MHDDNMEGINVENSSSHEAAGGRAGVGRTNTRKWQTVNSNFTQ